MKFAIVLAVFAGFLFCGSAARAEEPQTVESPFVRRVHGVKAQSYGIQIKGRGCMLVSYAQVPGEIWIWETSHGGISYIKPELYKGAVHITIFLEKELLEIDKPVDQAIADSVKNPLPAGRHCKEKLKEKYPDLKVE